MTRTTPPAHCEETAAAKQCTIEAQTAMAKEVHESHVPSLPPCPEPPPPPQGLLPGGVTIPPPWEGGGIVAK